MLRKLFGIGEKEKHYCPWCDCEVGSEEEAIEHARQDLSVPYVHEYEPQPPSDPAPGARGGEGERG